MKVEGVEFNVFHEIRSERLKSVLHPSTDNWGFVPRDHERVRELLALLLFYISCEEITNAYVSSWHEKWSKENRLQLFTSHFCETFNSTPFPTLSFSDPIPLSINVVRHLCPGYLGVGLCLGARWCPVGNHGERFRM